jgi:arsenate reductase
MCLEVIGGALMIKVKILFVGLRNSARSQMAEGFLRYLAGDLFEVFSAGIEADELHPLAIRVMNEVEIDISHHYVKSAEEYVTFNLGFVIAVCEVAYERWPIFHHAKNFQRWDLSDPTKVKGSVEKQRIPYGEEGKLNRGTQKRIDRPRGVPVYVMCV